MQEKKGVGRPKKTENGNTTIYLNITRDTNVKIEKQLDKINTKNGISLSKSEYIKSLIEKALG